MILVLPVQEHTWENPLSMAIFICISNSLHAIHLEFSPLVSHSRVDQNSPVLLDEPVLCSMAKKYNQTPALIALRYQLQRGVVALNSTLNEKRVKENTKVMNEAVGFRIVHTEALFVLL